MSSVDAVNESPDTLARFRALPIFAACSDDQLAEIDRLADEVHVAAGRTILRQGDLGKEFAMIVSGEADIVKDDTVVARVGAGDYFGEIALLDAITRNASVVAASDMVLEVIDRRGFNTLLDDLPALSRAMLKGLAHHMAELEAENQRLRAG